MISRTVAPAVLILTLFLPAARAADLDPFVPADSEWVLHINVKQLVDSPAAKNATERLRSGFRSGLDVLAPLHTVGLDPLKDVRSLCLAGSGLLQPDRVLWIAHGGFNAEKLRKAADEQVKKEPSAWKAHKQGEATVYEVRDKARPGPLFLVLRDDTTVLASPGKKYVLEAATGDPKKPPKVSRPLQALVAKADARDDVWLASVTPDRVHKLLAKNSSTTGIADDVTAFTARVNAGDTLKLTFHVQTKTKEAAAEVSQLLDAAKGFASLAAQGVDGLGPLLADLIDACKTSTAGTTATLAGQLSEDQIARALKKN